MARWLWEPAALDVSTYLANDDVRTGYHLLRWTEDGPEPLRQLSARLLERRLLKALDVSALPAEGRLELLALAQRQAAAGGLDPRVCCGLDQRQSRGYHPYKGGLRLWDGHTLEALEERSPLVSSLVKPIELCWLIHPAEVNQQLRQALQQRSAESRPPG
jgi:hypothetical protein